MQPRVLAIAAPDFDLSLIEQAAARMNAEVRTAASLEEALKLLLREYFNIILCDRDLPGLDWRESISRLSTSAKGSCILLASAVSDDYLWREVVLRGGYDIVAKPLNEKRLLRSLQLAWSYLRAGPVAS
jgi:DNA-binding NtrC family response regulator